MDVPLTPVERTAASEALRRKDKRIADLERKALTCPSCGCDSRMPPMRLRSYEGR